MTRATVQRPPQRGPLRTRRKLSDNPLDLDPSEIDPGIHYQWCAEECMGKPELMNMRRMIEAGFEPVKWEDRPEHMRLPNMTDAGLSQAVSHGGLVLMSRPSYLREEAENEDRAAARAQVRDKMAELGQSPSTNHAPRTAPAVSRTYGPAEGGDIPQD